MVQISVTNDKIKSSGWTNILEGEADLKDDYIVTANLNVITMKLPNDEKKKKKKKLIEILLH